MDKVCFLFGHATTGSEILPYIEAAAERHYIQYGIRTYIVGNHGSFDRLAATAIQHLKKKVQRYYVVAASGVSSRRTPCSLK